MVASSVMPRASAVQVITTSPLSLLSCRSQLAEAMEREHCHSSDSQAAFVTPNYGVSTTSEIEWHYVYNPTDKQMRVLSLNGKALTEWPGERKEAPCSLQAVLPCAASHQQVQSLQNDT